MAPVAAVSVRRVGTTAAEPAGSGREADDKLVATSSTPLGSAWLRVTAAQNDFISQKLRSQGSHFYGQCPAMLRTFTGLAALGDGSHQPPPAGIRNDGAAGQPSPVPHTVPGRYYPSNPGSGAEWPGPRVAYNPGSRLRTSKQPRGAASHRLLTDDDRAAADPGSHHRQAEEQPSSPALLVWRPTGLSHEGAGPSTTRRQRQGAPSPDLQRWADGMADERARRDEGRGKFSVHWRHPDLYSRARQPQPVVQFRPEAMLK